MTIGAGLGVGVGIGSASAKAPPFQLPGEHFSAAMCFLLFGAAGLIWIAPELAAGTYPQPSVVSVTHLFTLGWITMSIMGALYQFLPVALGEPIRSVGAAHLSFALYTPGVLAFVIGMAFHKTPVMLAGAALFGTAILIFTINLGATLWHATTRDVTWWALASADFFLVITLVLGLALAGNLHWSYLGAARLIALGTHLHIALFGWVMLVVVGVAQHLLPMFLLSHGVGERYAKFSVALLAAGAATLAVGHHGPPFISQWLPALFFSAGLIAFLLQARAFYTHRLRPSLDPGMQSVARALTIIAVALILGIVALFTGFAPRASSAYVLTMVLGISLFVAALYYKIVPFLVWFHRFGPLIGKTKMVRVSDIYSAKTASIAGGTLVAGVLLTLVGVLITHVEVIRVGAVVLTAGVSIEAAQMLSLARRKP